MLWVGLGRSVTTEKWRRIDDIALSDSDDIAASAYRIMMRSVADVGPSQL
jgi:hypothetical protein